MVTRILENNQIHIAFQPIISIRSAQVMGVEALLRVIDENNEVLSPVFVFDQAKKEHLSFELDKHVRRKTFETFQPLCESNSDLMLFINFESHLLDTLTIAIESFGFCSFVKEFNIPASRVVIEIKEYQINNTERLRTFCEFYKSRGFLIALDDFGAGNANFDRISTVLPHIVKIDRSIVYNVHKNFIHKEVLKSIANMCFNIGALVLAEGVESEEEILSCLKHGLDIFQGYWFAKPSLKPFDALLMQEKINKIGAKHTQNVKKSMQHKALLIESGATYAEIIIHAITHDGIEDLNLFLDKFDAIEALYCIDATNGIQKGQTFISIDTHAFFHPAKEGDNHTLKEYFYITQESTRGNYLSQKYISRASGRMCRTFAQKFTHEDVELILCLDLKL